jgi:hypothetical protein
VKWLAAQLQPDHPPSFSANQHLKLRVERKAISIRKLTQRVSRTN